MQPYSRSRLFGDPNSIQQKILFSDKEPARHQTTNQQQQQATTQRPYTAASPADASNRPRSPLSPQQASPADAIPAASAPEPEVTPNESHVEKEKN